MASIERNRPLRHRQPTVFRWPSLAKADIRTPFQTRTKRRKLPSVRLGGQRRGRRRFFLLRLFKRLKIRWLRLQYSYMLQKLKALYSSILKDLVATGESLEEIQKRIMLDSYFNVPVIGLGVASVPSHVERSVHR